MSVLQGPYSTRIRHEPEEYIILRDRMWTRTKRRTYGNLQAAEKAFEILANTPVEKLKVHDIRGTITCKKRDVIVEFYHESGSMYINFLNAKTGTEFEYSSDMSDMNHSIWTYRYRYLYSKMEGSRSSRLEDLRELMGVKNSFEDLIKRLEQELK